MAVAALAFAGATAARETSEPNSAANPYPVQGFEVPASNGYTLVVFGLEEERGRADRVFVEALKTGQEVVYEAPGTVGSGTLSAQIGTVGRVAVTFHPQGAERVPRPCDGGADYYEAGTFDGVVEFHGREGFTDVSLSNASVPPLFHTPGECIEVEGTRSARKGAELDAFSKYVHLRAIRNTPASRPRLMAESGYADDRARVYLKVELIGGKGVFRPSSNLRRAILAPPPPFSGTATYRLGRGRKARWTGDLSVDFPGVPDVPIGPRVAAELFKGSCRIFDRTPKPHPLAPPGLCLN